MSNDPKLARWLYERFHGDDFPEHWDELEVGHRIAWEETANDVIAAVAKLAAYKGKADK